MPSSLDLKMYIAVRDDVPDFMVPTLVAHTVLNAHFKFDGTPDYDSWLNESFKKVVVRVNAKEFNKIAEQTDCVLGCENTTLNQEMCCAVVCPMIDVDRPKVLSYAHTWRPK